MHIHRLGDGNAAFARIFHADVRGWKRMLVVTSSIHMPRTQAIFEWIFALAPRPALARQMGFEVAPTSPAMCAPPLVAGLGRIPG